MSEIQRVALHSAPRNRKEKEPPARSVRLGVELGASNEDQYPEINYRDLIVAHLRKNRSTENGKKPSLDPFSDNEDDVARLAKQFEHKYGSQSTYGRSGRAKRDEFADIGAGYDENDSFIDNTDGYDEMCPPGYDTFHGGFYINCGSLEFKNVQDERADGSDAEISAGQRNNKRRISSSSSEESSSDSSSESESGAEADKGKERVLNGEHKTERRKNKKVEAKKKAKKMRTDASAPTSGKHTSDDNGHHDGESVDSRTSHTEDSLTSKPAPSSENAVTSDSSRDVAETSKPETKLPPVVSLVLEEMSACISRLRQDGALTPDDMEPHTDQYILRLEQALGACSAEVRCRRAAWVAAAKILSAPRTRLLHRARDLAKGLARPAVLPQPPPAPAAAARVPDKKEVRVEPPETVVPAELTQDQKEQQINSILERLKGIIDNQKPAMMQTYKTDCERVMEENKKIAAVNATAAATESGTRIQERRLPKRRYPWCGRMRQLLAALVQLCGGAGGAGGEEAAARLLAHRVLPLFPPGFVRLPTLLRQANLNKDLKVAEMKKQKIPTPGQIVLNGPILPPSNLSVNSAAPKPPEKTHEVACGTNDDIKVNGKQFKSQAQPQTDNLATSSQKTTFNSIFSSFTLSPNTDVFLEKTKPKPDDQRGRDALTVEKVNEPAKINPEKHSKSIDSDKYVPPNSIGSITITPVTQSQKFDPRHQASKLANNTVTVSAKGPVTEATIRVKSPAEIMKAATVITKDDKHKKPEQKLPNTLHIKPPEKRSQSPLRIDTSYPKKAEVKSHSPSAGRQGNGENKQLDNLKSEVNLPRPVLIPIHHSPTFAKPADKREQPKPKDRVQIVNDVDPLSDVLQVDDSSSDVELVEDTAAKLGDPLSVPDNLKTQPELRKQEEVRSHKQDSNSSKHSKESKNEDKSKSERAAEKKDEPNALSRLKEDYSHKHSSHKRDHPVTQSDNQRKENHERSQTSQNYSEKLHKRDNYSQPEKTQKREDSERKDNSHLERSHKYESEKRDYFDKHKDRERRDGYSSPHRSHKIDDRSHQRPAENHRKDHAYESEKRDRMERSERDRPSDRDRADREKTSERERSSDRERQNRERLLDRERYAERDRPKDRQELDKQSNRSYESVHRKEEERKVCEQDGAVRKPALHKEMEVDYGDFDIDKVMRDLKDLKNSQEPQFNSSSVNAVKHAHAHRTTLQTEIFRKPNNDKTTEAEGMSKADGHNDR